MQWRTHLSTRATRRIAPLLLVSALVFAACGGGSSDKTATSASQSQTTAAATTIASGASTALSAATSAAAAATTPAPATTVAVATTEATSAPSAAASAAASSGGDVANSDVARQIADAWNKQTSYKITTNLYETGATTPSYVNITETNGDNRHSITTIQGQTLETIVIGNDYYSNTSGSWKKAPDLGVGSATPTDEANAIDDLASSDSEDQLTITKKGDDTLDGEAVTVYEMTDSSGDVFTLWVGKDDHLPRKSEAMTDDGRIEIIYSDYGKDFGIKAPI